MALPGARSEACWEILMGQQSVLRDSYGTAGYVGRFSKGSRALWKILLGKTYSGCVHMDVITCTYTVNKKKQK
jgi:hypothetical protein